VNPPAAPWLIVGQGLAGTCLAWHLWWKGQPFRIIDRCQGGSSRVAAGLINPITGKNFHSAPLTATFLPESIGFYQKIEGILSLRFWHPLPILRLAATAAEWTKIQSKLDHPDIACWLAPEQPAPPPGWHGAALLSGGGRLDTCAFLDSSRAFFEQHGCFSSADWDLSHPATSTILCEGAPGLIAGRAGPHRCAKGEILTVHAPHWPADHIRIGAGGWIIPLTDALFKIGATYEWDDLDEVPTAAGLAFAHEIAAKLADADFSIIAHQAGIRPILRRSEPLIGPLPSGHWFFNGLGSKGSLHAPATARILTDWLTEGTEPPPTFDIRRFLSPA